MLRQWVPEMRELKFAVIYAKSAISPSSLLKMKQTGPGVFLGNLLTLVDQPIHHGGFVAFAVSKPRINALRASQTDRIATYVFSAP